MPYPGGPEHYAAYLASTDGFEVELVAGRTRPATATPYRRRGLASLLLARAFRVLHQRGETEVTAEVDDTNTASRSLILRPGARREGGAVEVIRRRRAVGSR